MLRQYSSKGIRNFDLSSPKKDFSSTTLIGSGEGCDIVVQDKNVAERHALIEYHPLKSYWLRDLGTLGGTTCNGQSLYGLVEMNSADVIQFGDSAPYVFEIPVVQPSPKREKRYSLRIGHSKCTTEEVPNDPLVLPIVGNKIIPRASEERYLRQFSIGSNKKLCQLRRESELYKNILPGVQDSLTSNQILKDELSMNIRPISSKAKIRRSTSLNRQSIKDDQKTDRLPKRILRINRASFASSGNKHDTTSSGNSSAGEIKYPRLSLTKEENSTESPGTPVGSQLLRRIVRLQDELHRRDLEIEKLSEDALLPSTTGERVKNHLDEYRNALAKAQLENEKLRGKIFGNTCILLAILELNPPNMPEEEGGSAQQDEKIKNLDVELQIKEMIIKTFFSVCHNQLEELNKNISNTPMRDYADTFLEIIKSLQDPFSFRLMEINTKCGHMFDKQKFSDLHRHRLYEQFDKFLKGNVHPISKSLDIFFPVLKDAVTIARESVKTCAVFSQWSREFGDQITNDGLNWELLVYKVDDLHIRFREAGLSKHWLLPSLVPLFKTIAMENKKSNDGVNEKGLKTGYELQQAEEKISNLIIMVEEQKAELAKDQYEIEAYQSQIEEMKSELQSLPQEFEEISKYKEEIKKLEEKNRNLQKEKQDIEAEIEQLRVASENNITKLQSRHNSLASTINGISYIPRLMRPDAVPKIHLDDQTVTPSETSRGDTPERLQHLIEEHVAHAKPLSPISSFDVDEVLEDESKVEHFNESMEKEVEKGIGREKRSISEEETKIENFENRLSPEETSHEYVRPQEEIILTKTFEEPSDVEELSSKTEPKDHVEQKDEEVIGKISENDIQEESALKHEEIEDINVNDKVESPKIVENQNINLEDAITEVELENEQQSKYQDTYPTADNASNISEDDHYRINEPNTGSEPESNNKEILANQPAEAELSEPNNATRKSLSDIQSLSEQEEEEKSNSIDGVKSSSEIVENDEPQNDRESVQPDNHLNENNVHFYIDEKNPNESENNNKILPEERKTSIADDSGIAWEVSGKVDPGPKTPSPVETSRIDEVEEHISKADSHPEMYDNHGLDNHGESATDNSIDEDEESMVSPESILKGRFHCEKTDKKPTRKLMKKITLPSQNYLKTAQNLFFISKNVFHWIVWCNFCIVRAYSKIPHHFLDVFSSLKK